MSQDLIQGSSDANSATTTTADTTTITSQIDPKKDETQGDVKKDETQGDVKKDETKGDEIDEPEGDEKNEVVLSLTGTPEYNSFPYKQENNKFLFMASLKAPHYRQNKRTPIDLICVVDESGSMGGQPIELVKQTVKFIIKNLEHFDRFGCVGYSTSTREILPLTTMDTQGKDKATELVAQIKAGGSTALCAGLCHGLNLMRQRKIRNEVASVMLFTDGEATDGPTQAQDIIRATKDLNFLTNFSVHDDIDMQMQQTPMQYQTSNVQPKKQSFLGKLFSSSKSPSPTLTPITTTTTTNNNQNIQSQTTNNEETKPEPKKDNEDTNNDNPNMLPCTINTFGFGPNHKASLLQAIAEHGRGMYAFIEKGDMIADTFAECIGGLVSVVAQNIKLTVESKNNVKINRCVSQGYTVSEIKKNEKYTVAINDIQSEEHRDIIFELSIPSIKEPNNQFEFLQSSIEYKNVITNKDNDSKSVTSIIDRADTNDISERNYQLDIQVNRLTAADAMSNANALAQQGKLDEAKKILENAANNINKSKSSQDAFSTNLIQDIDTVKAKLNTTVEYEAYGSKMLNMNAKAHEMQRSVQSSAYTSQAAYANKSKAMMKSGFK